MTIPWDRNKAIGMFLCIAVVLWVPLLGVGGPVTVLYAIRSAVAVLPLAGIIFIVLNGLLRVTHPSVSPTPEARKRAKQIRFMMLFAAVVLGTIVFETQAVLRLFLSANR